MPKNNESKYLDALLSLKSGEKSEETIKIRISPSSLDLVEKLMGKMEWSLDTAINSCLTHTINMREDFSFSDFDSFSLGDDFEPFELDLSIKNENRISSLAKANTIELDERLISYILTKSIQLFQKVLLKKDGDKSGKE